MKIHVYDGEQQACRAAAFLFAAQLTKKPDSVLGLATGSTPIPCYADLVSFYEQGLLDFSEVVTFNLDEYCQIPLDHPCSYHRFMQENLFEHINIKKENIHIPADTGADAGKRYDAAIEAAGGIDLQLLGIGGNGHIGFNEPADAFSCGTHIVALTQSTIQANSRFFDSIDDVPRHAISMGTSNIMASASIVLIATGKAKAQAIYDTLRGPIDPQVPASILQLHQSVTFLLDRDAASLL